MKTATKTRLPKGLPQAIAWEVARQRKAGNDVWVLENLDVNYQGKQNQPKSKCQIWILLRKQPHHRKVYCMQWERWNHGSMNYTTTLTHTGNWEWNLDHAHAKWDSLVTKDGYRRVV